MWKLGLALVLTVVPLDPTVIEDNVIIDNLCQIAHNVHIGYGTAVAGGVIMAGSLKVGRFCQIGGASVIEWAYGDL